MTIADIAIVFFCGYNYKRNLIKKEGGINVSR